MTGQLEVDSLNSLPLNKKAREHLIKAGQRPDREILHVFQLMMWGFQQGIRPMPKYNTDLLDFLERLTYREDPKAALRYLTTNWDGDLSLTEESLDQESPEGGMDGTGRTDESDAVGPGVCGDVSVNRSMGACP